MIKENFNCSLDPGRSWFKPQNKLAENVITSSLLPWLLKQIGGRLLPLDTVSKDDLVTTYSISQLSTHFQKNKLKELHWLTTRGASLSELVLNTKTPPSLTQGSRLLSPINTSPAPLGCANIATLPFPLLISHCLGVWPSATVERLPCYWVLHTE